MNDTNNTPNGTNLENGKWVPVDTASLGFRLNGQPGQVISGPDGNYYKFSDSEPQLSSVASNYLNAIPTPSTIVQMPPIVQPIALVPYTSQNQPLLQYDPYSRPLDPPVQPKVPNYVKKPYKGISLAGFLFAAISAVLVLLVAFGLFKATATLPAFEIAGLSAIYTVLLILGIDAGESQYFESKIKILNGDSDLLGKIITYALPFIIIVIFVIFVLLMFKYLYKFAAKKTPRAFSVGAFINIILSISAIAMLLSMSNGAVEADARNANMGDFFMMKSIISMGIGAIVAFVGSVLLFIFPFFAKKNAYMLEKTDAETNKTFIMDQKK